MMDRIRSIFSPETFVALACFALCGGLFASPSQAQVVRDGTVGQSPGPIAPDAEGILIIEGDDGIRRGTNDEYVFHSFSQFDLGATDVARYTDTPAMLANVEMVVSRVTGGAASVLEGRIESMYPNADFVFANPNGIVTGSGFTIDVNQSAHFSTADFLELQDLNQVVMEIATGTTEFVPTFTTAFPVAWGFLETGPEAGIEIGGFTADDVGTNTEGFIFSFVADDLTIGSEENPVDIQTNGRHFTGIGFGNQDGRVANFTIDPLSEESGFGDLLVLSTTALVVRLTDSTSAQEEISAAGSVTVHGGIDTAPADSTPQRTGQILLWGDDLSVEGFLSTHAPDPLESIGSGDVVLLGTTDIFFGGDIETESINGSGGNVVFLSFIDSIEIDDFSTIETAAESGDGRSGGVLLAAPQVTANNVTISLSEPENDTRGAGNVVAILGTTIDFTNSTIQGRTLNNIASGVVIQGDTVDLSGTFIDVSTSGEGSNNGGNATITGNLALDVTGSVVNATGAGVTDGGNIFVSSADFVGGTPAPPDFDVRAFGTGQDGVLTVVSLGDTPPISGQSDSLGTTDPLAPVEVTANDPPFADPDFSELSDPIGLDDLAPFEPTSEFALAPGASEADGDAAADAGPSPPGAAGEEIVALAETAEATAARKPTAVPGVSLFTNASQNAPLVPRTCDSIASRDTQSKLLARPSKRLPTSPEDWLIAFDTTGDRLLASAENPELPPVAAGEGSKENADEVMRRARTQRALATAASAVQAGRYEEASAGFEEAVSELEGAGERRGASEALLAYAQLQIADGRYPAARRSLERALRLAETEGDEGLIAAVRASLGNALIGTGDLGRAEEELTRGLHIVMASKDSEPAAASALNNLGNQHAANHDYESALWAYKRSAEIAHELGRKGDEARALSGAARAAADSGKFADARQLLDRAMALVDALEDPRARAPIYIHIGSTYAQFVTASPSGRKASLLSAFVAFQAALEAAEKTGDSRGVALANLNLGALYQAEQHRSEALYLTRVARRAAEGIDAPELLYRAHWQEGQILWAEHQVNASLAAHRRAVAILEQTKPLASDGYGTSDSSFRMAVGNVYRDTVDLLLRAASLTAKPETADLLIVEARDTLERLKAAELRDYFEDDCIASVGGEGRDIDHLGGNAAVVYTVTLSDRMEMLVGLPSGVERFTTKVRASRLNKTVDQFRAAVQNPLSTGHRALGRKLYRWTVEPYAERLADSGIETLVFIPDGRLRTLPFAALSDGDEYLGERYATATALSLKLLAPTDFESETGRPVLAGVSEGVQGFSELAAVDDELAEIQRIEGGGELLLNDAFTLDRVRTAVAQEVPGVVHLATHAVFTGNPDTSFILTYGGRVGFDELSDVVGMTRADGAPLDLLVLSACETAVGNDRAGLGFTGSAIRAGARSALGSLWPISDAAAGELMVNFYRGLQSPDSNKAEALRQAQAGLRESERFAHPFYWAPFTLVNDWM